MELLMDLGRQNLVPAVTDVPPAERVLVLAPHMDDETIGCGGAVLRHVAAGARVEVAWITDGVRGFSEADMAAMSEEQRRATRREEGALACERLGVAGTHCLDLPDGRSAADEPAVDKLLAVVEQVRPQVVYLPFLTDSHYDHRTTNRLFIAAAARSGALSGVVCCGYEVWTPLYPNCVVDISAEIEHKMSALACYRSQLQINDYLSSVRGLNAYRAIANHSQGFAEAYYRVGVSEYLRLAEHL